MHSQLVERQELVPCVDDSQQQQQLLYSTLVPLKGVDVLANGRYRVQLNAFMNTATGHSHSRRKKKFSRNSVDLYEVSGACSCLSVHLPCVVVGCSVVSCRWMDGWMDHREEAPVYSYLLRSTQLTTGPMDIGDCPPHLRQPVSPVRHAAHRKLLLPSSSGY